MRPNIVWILCDELRADALGCYGYRGAPPHTPALDGLAEAGMRFERAYCNSPVCVPSRTSMLTATWPEQNGVYHNEAAWASFRPARDLMTFPEWFAEHGYITATFGKSHVPANIRPWQRENKDGSEMGFFRHISNYDFELLAPPGIPTAIAGRFPADRPYPPEVVTRNALEFLGQNHERPFLLRVSYLQPHTPVVPPEPYASMFADVAWPEDDLSDATVSAFERRHGEVVGGRSLSARDKARAKAAYHGLVAWIDVQVAQVLDAVRARGDADRTIIVFNADHGAGLGELGRYGKQVFAPDSQRVPTLYSWPGTIPAGVVRNDLAQCLDMARTLGALCSIAPHEQFGGRNLFGDPAPARIYSTVGYGLPESSAFSNLGVGRWPDGSGWPRRACVRTDRFRLDMNVRRNGGAVPPDEEDMFLADVWQDPAELRNEAANPEYGAVVCELRQDLIARAREAVEPPFVPTFSMRELGAFGTHAS